MKNYDLVISLGRNCNCASNLKYYNLRRIDEKMPFDWIKHGTLALRIDVILNDFDGFLDPMNLRQMFGNKIPLKDKRYYNVVYD
ncbi:MAG: papain-like cysteine peptidase, partial [Rickettsiales bacterium]|nr:papain-like cysteine peptidase [Rickettsiales bacterium]